jgi:uncharacterized protein (DUF2062 family)
MVVLKKAKNIFYEAIKTDHSPKKLALSFSVGLFIAFSPFPGVHTVIMIASKWLLGLNFPILFFATSINNPWTIIPCYVLDYSFGYWLVHSFLGYSPSWIVSLEKIFGSGNICLWSFFIGGNVLGLVFGFLSYPFMVWFFRALSSKRGNK